MIFTHRPTNHSTYDFILNRILSDGASRMDEEMIFSLSYEQMTQMAEEEIKQCDFRRDGTHYVWEVNKAHDILRFWYLLALRGHTGLATTRVEADYKRLKTLISQRNEGQ